MFPKNLKQHGLFVVHFVGKRTFTSKNLIARLMIFGMHRHIQLRNLYF